MLAPSAGLIRLANESGVSESSRARFPAAPIMDTPAGADEVEALAFMAAAAAAAGAPPRPGAAPRVAPLIAPRRPLAPPLAPRIETDSDGVDEVAPAVESALTEDADPACNEGFLGRTADGLEGRGPDVPGAGGAAVEVEATGVDVAAFDADEAEDGGACTAAIC